MKRMFIALAMLLVFAQVTLAGSGSAVIPHLRWSISSPGPDNLIPEIYLSNITDKPLNVTLAFFEQEGQVFLDGDGSAATGMIRVRGAAVTNYDEAPNQGSVSFQLAAKNTVRVVLIGPDDASDRIGFGTIEWSKNNVTAVGLIASMRALRVEGDQGGFSQINVPINNGVPF